MDDKERKKLIDRQMLVGQIHAASDDVFQITGRTDQTVEQIAILFPSHAAVKALHAARAKLKEFDNAK